MGDGYPRILTASVGQCSRQGSKEITRMSDGMQCVYRHELAFWIVAGIFSFFRGWYGFTILVMEGTKTVTPWSERKFPSDRRHRWSWWTHQIFINFAGSMIGCGAAYYLVVSCGEFDGKFNSVAFVFLLGVAVAGIFGFLPFIVSKLTSMKG